MSASEESLALVMAALEVEEETFNFAPLNFQSKLMETNLVLLHRQFQIPSKF